MRLGSHSKLVVSTMQIGKNENLFCILLLTGVAIAAGWPAASKRVRVGFDSGAESVFTGCGQPAGQWPRRLINRIQKRFFIFLRFASLKQPI